MAAPLIISTWSFGKRGNDAAWPKLQRGGSSLDAVEHACRVIELDPDVDSVGFGGLPDSSGHVSLDGCIMLAPNRCGSVCSVRRFLHPVSIARQVMEKTSHLMLAGAGADEFAAQQGFVPADLLSAEAQRAWETWSRNREQPDQSQDRMYVGPAGAGIRPMDRAEPSGRGSGRLFRHPAPEIEKGKSDESTWKHHDTIGVLAIDAKGVLAGGCSTSGTPFKMPGRVGDSPIIGHGLYVDPAHGAAVATGTGELIMSVCGSFLAVELMRRGATPLDALRQTLQRIIDNNQLRSDHQVAMIALRPDGSAPTFASAALRSGYKTSVTDQSGSRIVPPDAVLVP